MSGCWRAKEPIIDYGAKHQSDSAEAVSDRMPLDKQNLSRTTGCVTPASIYTLSGSRANRNNETQATDRDLHPSKMQFNGSYETEFE